MAFNYSTIKWFYLYYQLFHEIIENTLDYGKAIIQVTMYLYRTKNKLRLTLKV